MSPAPKTQIFLISMIFTLLPFYIFPVLANQAKPGYCGFERAIDSRVNFDASYNTSMAF
jgi:hypothetical protein